MFSYKSTNQPIKKLQNRKKKLEKEKLYINKVRRTPQITKKYQLLKLLRLQTLVYKTKRGILGYENYICIITLSIYISEEASRIGSERLPLV